MALKFEIKSTSRPLIAPSSVAPSAERAKGGEDDSGDEDCLNWTYSPKIECFKDGKTKCFIRTPQYTETNERHHALHLVREFEIVPDKQVRNTIPQALATSRSLPGVVREEDLPKLSKRALPPVHIPPQASGEKARSRYTLYRATCPKQRHTYMRNTESYREGDVAAKTETPLSTDRTTLESSRRQKRFATHSNCASTYATEERQRPATEPSGRKLRDLKVDVRGLLSSKDKKHMAIAGSSSLPSLREMLR